MESVQTLHDFVLNMLNDPTALSSFAADPQGALSSAGLGDVSVADVHDIVPLVLEYAPAHAVSALEAMQSSMSFDGLTESGAAGAISQLQALTDNLGTLSMHVDSAQGVGGVAADVTSPLLGSEVNTTDGASLQNGLLGAIGATSPLAHGGGDLAVGGMTTFEDQGGFAATGDLAGGLDSDTISRVTGGELDSSALSGAAAFATNVISDPSSALHPVEVTNALTGAVAGTGLSLPIALPTSDPGQAVSDTLHSVLANVPNPTQMGGELGHLGNLGGLTNLGNATDALNNMTHDPFGALSQHLPAGVSDSVSNAVSSVTSHIPGASDALHTGTSDLHSPVTDLHSATGEVTSASSASPLDGLSASSVGDTVNHTTHDVSGLLHNVLPTDLGDHPLL